MNILDQIVSQRKKDIKEKGFNLGFSIPEKRNRGITPFLPQKGVILEIKRASPSKGDIAPSLNPKETAKIYAKAGASAISVLTEEHWFKGSLEDLKNACASVDDYALQNNTTPPAILRKDFLISEEEIDIAYLCGADAVLIIARILESEKMISMVKKCESLGITALIELRLEEDLKKLKKVVEKVGSKTIVCGVNARDLKNFSIDMLTPAALLSEIRSIAGNNIRVIFESGIRTNEAANFAGSLGFSAMLLGEAAARNPEKASLLVSSFVNSQSTKNAEEWNKIAEKIENKRKTQNNIPFIKVCGLTNEKDAIKAATLGADFLGFIFYNKSPRKVNPTDMKKISNALKQNGLRDKVRMVGVIVETDSQDSENAFHELKEGNLDFIQLHGEKCFKSFKNKEIPHYAVVNINNEDDLSIIDEIRITGEPRILIDAKVGSHIGGTGTKISDMLIEKVSQKTKLWLAGGINPENVNEIIDKFHPELIDVASGIESKEGIKDHQKMEKFFSEISKINK